MEPFLGGIYIVGFNFAPQGYTLCNGDILAISTNTALFSLIGTFYGGNGINTFALPDLRGRVAIHQGQGAGLSSYTVGQVGGTESDIMTTNQMPVHAHAFNVKAGVGNSSTPDGTTSFASGPATGSGPNATLLKMYVTSAPNVPINAGAVSDAGGGQPFSIIQPYISVSYIIALQGIFPARN